MSSQQQLPRPDPLIDEVRRIRKEISDAHGNDVGRLCEHLQEVQRQYADRVVRRKRSRPRHTSDDVA